MGRPLIDTSSSSNPGPGEVLFRFSESVDDSKQFFKLFKCARATSSGQNSQWMTLKGLYCTGGALKQRIPGIIWANPLKMHGVVMRGLLSVRVAHEH